MTRGAALAGLAVAMALITAYTLLQGKAWGHDMYSDWTDSRGYSCCNETDCRPTVTCETSAGGLGVRAEGRCVPVPADACRCRRMRFSIDSRPMGARTSACPRVRCCRGAS